MKGGFGGDWRYLGPQDNKLDIDTIDTIDTIDGMDPEDAKKYYESKKKGYVELMKTMIEQYIKESKSIEEYKQDFRPEGELGSDVIILFKLLEQHRNDISNGLLKPCIDRLYSYIYLIRLLEKDYQEQKGSKKYKRKRKPKTKSRMKHRRSKHKKKGSRPKER